MKSELNFDLKRWKFIVADVKLILKEQKEDWAIIISPNDSCHFSAYIERSESYLFLVLLYWRNNQDPRQVLNKAIEYAQTGLAFAKSSGIVISQKALYPNGLIRVIPSG